MSTHARRRTGRSPRRARTADHEPRELGPPPAHAGLLALQRAAGNAAVGRLLTGWPRAVSLADVARAPGGAPADRIVLRVPVAQPPRRGFQTIQERRQDVSLAAMTGGLTLIQMAGAFQPPAWRPGARPERRDSTTVWRPVVEPTQVQDVAHESLYPAPGDHDRFETSEQEIDGRTWRHVLRITPEQSGEIRDGEQEHLNDAALAFRLTYQAIADAINAVAALDLPAQPSREAALAAADAELARRLPAGVGTDPARWPAVLDRLLGASKTRDEREWHTVTTLPRTRQEPSTSRIIWFLDTSGLQLGTPSEQIVRLGEAGEQGGAD